MAEFPGVPEVFGGDTRANVRTMDLESTDARVAQAFIKPQKRNRFLSLASCRRRDAGGDVAIGSAKLHSKYRLMLANLEHWFDDRHAPLPLDLSDPHSGARAAIAARESSVEVYVMSYASEIDGHVMSLDEALQVLAQGTIYGTLIIEPSCSVAYYEQCEHAALSRLLRGDL